MPWTPTRILSCRLHSYCYHQTKLFCFLFAHWQICPLLGHFPRQYKHASVTPLLKKPGLDPTVSANIRPICNLNNISKILERLFLRRLFNHLQSDYCKHPSTETSLIHILDYLSIMQLIMGSPLFSLDLSAAFDTIYYTILFNHLTFSFGIKGSSHNWLKPYLSNRSFSVTSSSSSSFILPSRCGVLQGSVLGPILFTMYISLIASIVSFHGINQQQYADDTQLFFFISPSSLSSSLCSLQRRISSRHSWFLHNGLVLNPTVRRPENNVFGPPNIAWSMTLTLDVCQITLPQIAALAIFSPKATRATLQLA